MRGRERWVNPGSSDSKNILSINQEVRQIYHHLLTTSRTHTLSASLQSKQGEEAAEKMTLGETKPQPTFLSLSSEPSTSPSFVRKMKPHSSKSTKMLTYTVTNTHTHKRTHAYTHKHAHTLEDYRILYLKNPRKPPEKPSKYFFNALW